ncbi:hypothetical protein VPH35_086175 [Triticum aestivum]
MPALMAKRSSSERCAIRRELHRRRKLAAAPKGGIVKKSSANQSSASTHNSSADEPAGPATKKPSSMIMPMPRPRAGVAMSPASILQHAPATVATKKQHAAVAKEIAYVPIAKRCTAPPRRSALIPTASAMKVMPSAATRPRSPSTWVKKGMTVKVRTRAGILPTGHCLLLWLAARVVSDTAADDGYVEVIYDGNFPRDDPLRTVRVAMDDVRSMPAIVES